MRTQLQQRTKPCIRRTQPTAPTPTASLWQCSCGTWWGQRDLSDTEAEGLYLLRTAEPALPWFTWDNFRGWRDTSVTEHTCPDCDCKVEHPRLVLY